MPCFPLFFSLIRPPQNCGNKSQKQTNKSQKQTKIQPPRAFRTPSPSQIHLQVPHLHLNKPTSTLADSPAEPTFTFKDSPSDPPPPPSQTHLKSSQPHPFSRLGGLPEAQNSRSCELSGVEIIPKIYRIFLGLPTETARFLSESGNV